LKAIDLHAKEKLQKVDPQKIRFITEIENLLKNYTNILRIPKNNISFYGFQ